MHCKGNGFCFCFLVFKIEGKLENEIQGRVGGDPSVHICKKYFDLG